MFTLVSMEQKKSLVLPLERIHSEPAGHHLKGRNPRDTHTITEPYTSLFLNSLLQYEYMNIYDLMFDKSIIIKQYCTRPAQR